MVTKVCVALDDECLAQLDYLRGFLRLNPSVKRSQLIRQIVFELYMRCQSSGDSVFSPYIPGLDSGQDVDGYLDVE